MFIFTGGAPTNITTRQIGLGMVLVSWTVPPAPPSRGYRITVDNVNENINSSSSHTITGLQLGMHNIFVMSLSQHLPSEAVGPVEVVVRGEDDS